MSKLLQEVARFYTRNYPDLADLTFVCPNKRSAMFLKHYFQKEAAGAPVFMPRFAPFPAWVARMAPRSVPDRWEALFMLYDAYRNVLRRNGRPGQISDFDRFVFWGDIIISDFDDIDRSLASAADVYRNLYNLRVIQADYLTDDQKEIVRMLWGDTPMTRHIDTFWFHTGPGKDNAAPGSLSEKFIALWEVLGQLYTEFRAMLESKGMATAGMQERIALENILDTPLDALGRGRRTVFVGLADIFPVEIKILERFALTGRADFIWDTLCTDIYAGASTEPRGLARVRRLAARFPQPDGFAGARAPDTRRIEILGIPSAIGQAKMAGQIVAGLKDSGALAGTGGINTAIIVPDEKLLMPLMLALPDTGSLNVTMALPFAQTSFATLLRSIVALQMRMRKRRGDFTFFYADVLEVLSHPHIALIAADQAAALRDHINRKALYNIDAGTLDRFAPALSFIFNPVSDPDSSGPVYDYLRGLLDGLYTALRARSTVQAAEESFELQSLTALSDKLSRLRDLMDIYKVDVSEGTVMMMFERLLTSGMLTMSGTPLRGLQVMGALETRLLDFDNVIFLSLNERVFPQRNVLKTMIPANLRRGYGLSPIDREENSLNYYFYRLLSRAAHAWLLYDSRPAALGGGEPSRYLSQLVYGPLARCEGVEVTSALADMQTEAPPRREITVSKTPEVLAELARYFDSGSDRNLSASGLKEYMKCPLSFYLKYVRGYRSDDEPADYINAAQAGDILHHIMQALYGRYTGQVIDAGVIDGILAGDDIRRLLLEEYYRLRPSERGLPLERLQPEGIIVLSQIELQIRQMLQIERGQYAPFVYVGGETDRAHVHEQWQITPSLRVNFKMSIDRIDASVDGASLRFVDYKTGADKTGLGSKFENMFSGDHYYQAIFQLLLYREAWRDLRGFRGPIEPVIHSMHSIMRENRIVPLTYNAAPITAQPELYAEFRTRLEQIVTAIFDSDTPFCQASDIDRCRFCEFATMCNRQASPEKEY